MAESTDKKTRRIAEKRVESGKEFESYQEAQNQLLAIQAEQQQNLALQANNAMNMQAQRQTLGQAAEIMAMDGLNSTTRNVLGGYGLNQPRVIKETKVVKQGPQNITINNNTTNIQGPVQGRDVSIRPAEDSQGKFKAWLTNVFARQDAQFQKQNLEYQRRESSLTRNANKMMRKLEGLGKDITSAMDPRKMAQRMSNPFMNMLKAIGLIGLATRLPKILGAVNRVETTVRGWVSKLGELFDGSRNGLDLDDPKTLIGKIRFALWNKEETGVFNVILEKLSRALYDRKQLADNILGEIKWGELKSPGTAMKGLLDWLSVFFGGTKAARGVLNKEKEEEIRDNMHLSDRFNGGVSDKMWYNGDKTSINLTDKGNAVLVKKVGGGTDINAEYEAWAKSKGYKGSKLALGETKMEFLKERGNDLLSYFGEADILTLRLHKSTRDLTYKKAHYARTTNKDQILEYSTLTKLDLGPFGDRLNSSSHRGTLAVSLDIFKMLRGVYKNVNSQGVTNVKLANQSYRQDIKMDELLYLLKLLSTTNDIIVFEKFTDLFKVPKENIERVTIKLINKSISGTREREFYQSDFDFSTYYRKIVYEKAEGDKIKLVEEPDFNNRVGEDHWSVVRIDNSVVNQIIYKLVGTSRIEDYTIDTQELALKNLKDQGIITEMRKNATQEGYINTLDRGSKYEKSMSGVKETEYEADLFKNGGVVDNYSGVSSDGYRIYDNVSASNNLPNSGDQKSRRDAIFNYLTRTLGFSKEVAAGILGVIFNESGFNPTVTARDSDGHLAGAGIIQWAGSRKKKFKEWYESKHGKGSYPDGENNTGLIRLPIETQLDFLKYELETSYKDVYGKLKDIDKSSMNNYEKLYRAAYIWTKDFEGGGTREEDWPKKFTHRDKNGNLIRHTFEGQFKKRLRDSLGFYKTLVGSDLSSGGGNGSFGSNASISTTTEPSNSSSYGLDLLRNPDTGPTAYSYIGGTNTATKTNTPTPNASTAGKNVKAGSKNNKTNTSNGSMPKSVADAASVATAQEVAEVNANTKCSLQYQADLLNEAKAIRAELRSKGGGNSSPAKTNTKKQQP